MPSELKGAWPYERDDPDRIVIAPSTSEGSSERPPVRIFLGTEEGQYRAERVFVYSVIKHRDPARAYEIFLMKNLSGFNRRGWRTGFTCYRFAIPDLAGRHGRAIYNDVDQIYLADPALLFDLPLDAHGYLAIDARDTSVMLIDNGRMLEFWNRPAASAGRKGELTNGPAAVPGLWGELDPHWNARDLEYIEGRTRCLHYTALHQQPWNPFPDQYSYHQNPLAYLWHDLEREADAEGFELFSPESPSPAFRALAASGRPAEAGVRPLSPSAGATQLLQGGEGPVLVVTLDDAGAGAALDRPADTVALADRAELPAGPFDAVVATGLFERLPPGDAGWVLRDLFDRAGRALMLRIHAQAGEGVGSPGWWRRRVELAAGRFPAVAWHLDVTSASGARESVGVQRITPPRAPEVWLLTTAGEAPDPQAVSLAESLAAPYTVKRIARGRLAGLPNALLGGSLLGVARRESDPIDGPPPDLVIASDRRDVPVARWIRARSGGQTRLVQLGRPRAPFDLFDLIIATPEERLPIRGNVVQLAAPLAAGPVRSRPIEPFAKRLAELPEPRVALFVGAAAGPYRIDAAAARQLARTASEAAAGGSLLVWLDPALPDEVEEGVREALTGPRWVERTSRDLKDGLYGVFRALGARYVLHAGDPETLADLLVTGRPVFLFDLPRWHDQLPVLRPAMRRLLPLVLGKSYRGTPLQQHFPGRIVDWLITHGILHRPRDPEALHRALEARGLLSRIGATEPVASPKPLDDLARATDRVRRLLSERALSA